MTFYETINIPGFKQQDLEVKASINRKRIPSEPSEICRHAEQLVKW